MVEIYRPEPFSGGQLFWLIGKPLFRNSGCFGGICRVLVLPLRTAALPAELFPDRLRCRSGGFHAYLPEIPHMEGFPDWQYHHFCGIIPGT